MNSRFKFRGMTLGGEWVYGNLAVINKKIKPYRITIDEGYYISNTVGMPFAYPVRPETVEQCTGLKDKNGNLIYEGDIVMSPDGICYKIIWKKSCYFAKKLKTPNDIYYRPEPLLAQKFIEMRGFKITGNIHENKGQ